MSYDKPFSERERALEAAFFRKEDARLISALKLKKEHEAAVRELAEACGFRDETLQDTLLALGVSPGTLPAFVLAPLILTAWANGTVTRGERDAVLEVAHQEGIEAGTPPHDLLDAWLSGRPPTGLFEAWLAYVRALEVRGNPLHEGVLRNAVSKRARSVARASGGVVGVGSISKAERAVLDAIDDVLF